jgi:hypothetical protein
MYLVEVVVDEWGVFIVKVDQNAAKSIAYR